MRRRGKYLEKTERNRFLAMKTKRNILLERRTCSTDVSESFCCCYDFCFLLPGWICSSSQKGFRIFCRHLWLRPLCSVVVASVVNHTYIVRSRILCSTEMSSSSLFLHYSHYASFSTTFANDSHRRRIDGGQQPAAAFTPHRRSLAGGQ